MSSTTFSSHPLAPWLDLARSALPALKQAGGALPAGLAQWANHMKSTLELGKDIQALQHATSFALLQAQLGMLGAAAPARIAQQLLDVQVDTVNQLYAGWKTQSDQAATRNAACITALRQAQNHDDAAFVMAGFLRDAETAMRKAAGESAMLVNSGSAAADLLVHRFLDELIAQPAAASAPPQEGSGT